MIRKIKLAPLFFKYFFTFLFVTLDLSKSIFFVIFINNTLIFFISPMFSIYVILIIFFVIFSFLICFIFIIFKLLFLYF